MRMSITTTSGGSVAARRTRRRRRPRPRRPRSTSVSVSRIIRKPARTIAWSSAMRTRRSSCRPAAGGGRGPRSRRPACGPASSVPPYSATRSRMPTRPCPPLSAARRPRRAPSSTTSTRERRPRYAGRARDPRAGACLSELVSASWRIRNAERAARAQVVEVPVDVQLDAAGAAHLGDQLVEARGRRERRRGAVLAVARRKPSRRRISATASRPSLDGQQHFALAAPGRCEQPAAHRARLHAHHLMLWPITSCSSRAMRARSSATPRRASRSRSSASCAPRARRPRSPSRAPRGRPAAR